MIHSWKGEIEAGYCFNSRIKYISSLILPQKILFLRHYCLQKFKT